MYVTNPVYAILQPSALFFMSANVAVPPIHFETVTFHRGDCNTTPSTTISVSQLLASMNGDTDMSIAHDRLHSDLRRMNFHIAKALRSNVNSRERLRGTLFLLSEDLDAWGGRQVAYFNIKLDQLSDLEDNDSVLHHWESPFLHRNLIGATMCSLIVGVVLACLATFCINTGLSYVLRERSLTKRAQMRAIVGLNIKNFQKELDSHTTSRAERDAPFEFIFDLFDSILIDPVISWLRPTIASFIRGHYKKDPKSFVYLRDFKRAYDPYCFRRNCLPIVRKDELARGIIKYGNKYLCNGRRCDEDKLEENEHHHRVHIDTLMVRRLYHIKWLDEDKVFDAKDYIKREEKDGNFRMLNFPVEHSAIVNAFLKVKCDYSPGNVCMDDYIHISDHRDRSGNDIDGFQTRLTKWCKAQNLVVPALIGDEWAGCLPNKIKYRGQEKVRRIFGIAEKPGANLRDSITEVAANIEPCKEKVLDLFIGIYRVSTIFFVAMSAELVFVWFLLQVQTLWVQTSGSSRALIATDIFQPAPGTDAPFTAKGLLIVQIMISEVVAFLLATLIYAMIHYSRLEPYVMHAVEGAWRGGRSALEKNPEKKSKYVSLKWDTMWDTMLKTILLNILIGFRHFYAILLALQIWLHLALVFMIMAWFQLAALLDPHKFLPLGGAVITLVGAGFHVFTEMRKARAYFGVLLEEQFDALLTRRVDAAKLVQQREEYEKAARETQETDKRKELLDNAIKENVDDAKNMEKRHTVTTEELFAFLDECAQTGRTDGKLTEAEFELLFDLLDFPFAESQRKRLFAYCDVFGKGFVTFEEFEKGWNHVKEEFLEESFKFVGVSRGQILLSISAVVVSLAFFLTFILLAVGAWSMRSDFDSVVSTVLIGVMGKAATLFRKRGQAELSKASQSKPDQVINMLIHREAGKG